MEKIILNNISKVNNTISYSFSVTDGIVPFFSEKTFRIEYPENIETVPNCIACIPFVANVLPIVWLADCELVLDEIDEAFYNCLPNLKHGYEKMFPESKWLGKISANKILVCKKSSSNRSAMFFSGGLDSVQTLISHIDEKPHLISVWGSDIKYDNKNGWDVVYNELRKTAEHYNLKSVVIHSTFREFDCESKLDGTFSKQLKDGWWHGVKHGIGLLGHVAPYAYLNHISTMFIASSNCPQDGAVRCASNPVTDNTVRFANCKVVHDGFEFSRQDKIKNIAVFCNKNQDYIPLHVCWESQTGSNCCHCEKCYRTMAGLIAEGEDPQNYGFDKSNIFVAEMKQFIISNKRTYISAIKNQWSHIQKRVIENKSLLKSQSKYWKDIKWIVKADFSNIDLLGLSFFSRIRCKLSGFRFYQMLHDVKYKLIEQKKTNIAIKPIKRKLKSDKDAALYVFTPTHTNLGDHAIACATMELFDKSNFNYIEMTDEDLYLLNRNNSLNILNGRKILIHGGGNLGTLWPECERMSRKIVEFNPDSEIIFLPNTIFYENTNEGTAELKKSIQIYNKHKNLVFYAREKASYEYMKNIYKNVKLCPDMVLSLEGQDIPNNNRQGCLVCLRSDREKTLDKKSTKSVLKQVESIFSNDYKITDMYSLSPFDIKDREQILKEKFEQFRNAELVITDRLHGMIFSAVTGTPCIVLNSKSPKVKGCYDWIKDLDYIRFCDNLSEMADMSKELLELKNCKYNNSALKDYYVNLMKHIKQ